MPFWSLDFSAENPMMCPWMDASMSDASEFDEP